MKQLQCFAKQLTRNHLIHASPLTSHVEKRIILHDMNYWDNSEFIFNVFHGTFNNLTRVYKHNFQSVFYFFFIPWRFNQCHIVSYFYCPFFVLYCDSLEVYSVLCVCRITWCYQSQWCETVFPAPLHSESHQRRTPGTHQGRAFHHLQGNRDFSCTPHSFLTPQTVVSISTMGIYVTTSLQEKQAAITHSITNVFNII